MKPRLPRVIPNDEQIVSTTNPDEVYHKAPFDGTTERKTRGQHTSTNPSPVEIRAREAKGLFARVIKAGKDNGHIYVVSHKLKKDDRWHLRFLMESADERGIFADEQSDGTLVILPPGRKRIIVHFIHSDQLVTP